MTDDERLPVSTLISQALVAFTIEVDNEFEHRMPPRTTWAAAAGTTGPWLVSFAIWANFMQYLDPHGSRLGELEALERMANLPGLERWGYVSVAPDPADPRPRPPRPEWLVRPTRAGLAAGQTWRVLPDLIESRWSGRYGASRMTTLSESLQALAPPDPALPGFLPVVTGEMFTVLPTVGLPPSDLASSDLLVRLARVRLAFTVEAERDCPLSLPISANLLRVLALTPIRLAELPRLTAVSRQAVSMALGTLTRGGFAVVAPVAGSSRGQAAHLTAKGVRAQADCRERVGQVESSWRHRFGAVAIEAVRGARTAGRRPVRREIPTAA